MSIRELKPFTFLMVSKKSGKIQVEKTFYGKDGSNMTAKGHAIIAAKRWGLENGFVVKSS